MLDVHHRLMDHLKLVFGAEKPPPSYVFEQVSLTAVTAADRKYLFFLSGRGRESQAYWVKANAIEKRRPAILIKSSAAHRIPASLFLPEE